MITYPNITKAHADVVELLIDAGVLYVDEKGIHANVDGAYTVEKPIVLND